MPSLSELMRARLSGVRIYDLTDFYERFLFKLPVLNLRDGWLILAHGFDLLHHTIALRAKRVIDVVLSFALMLALSPLMLVTAIAIKLDSKGPVFYRQMRTGLNGHDVQAVQVPHHGRGRREVRRPVGGEE